MKKIFLTFILFALPFIANAEQVKIDDLWYELITKVEIAEVINSKDGISYSGGIIIPEKVTYNGIEYSVTSIGEEAFSGCYSLTSITIPNSVTSIGGRAFSGCFSLTSITIPNSVTNMGGNAFYSCSSLTSITIPNSMKRIEREMFAHSGLESITIPNSVIAIESYAFSCCSNLKNITIPNSVTTISEGAFSGCGLESINIPNSVTSIGGWAFSGCSNLKSINISNSVTSIGTDLFLGCYSLTSVTIPNSVTSIESRAFFNCTSLTSITIPNSVISIGEEGVETFANCVNLTDVYCYAEDVPITVSNAFDGSFIEYATLHVPDSVINDYKTTEPWSQFGHILALPPIVNTEIDNLWYKVIEVSNTAEVIRNPYDTITYKGDIIIPEKVTYNGVEYSVTGIEDEAFSNCFSLTSITIPNSITTIREEAFANCKNLTDVYCYAENVPYTYSDAFDSCYIEYVTLHVPESAIEKYKSTEPWSQFGSFMTLLGEVSEEKKCATPTISYQNGKLTFTCETDSAEFISEITNEDTGMHYESEIEMKACYIVSVYATTPGYKNSDTATATLYWINCEEKHESENNNSVINIPSTPILIQSQNGILVIDGLPKGTYVSVYTTTGVEVVNGVAEEDIALTLDTQMKKGDVALIKMGTKSVKVVMK